MISIFVDEKDEGGKSGNRTDTEVKKIRGQERSLKTRSRIKKRTIKTRNKTTKRQVPEDKRAIKPEDKGARRL